MKRFLMLVGVAVVAAAMYVAASPASQQSTGVSKKQFVALEKKVTAQGKTLKAVTSLLKACVQIAIPIDQFGDGQNQTEGYDYSQPAGAGNFLTTALDVSDASDTGAVWFIGGDAGCGAALGESGLRHGAGLAGLRFPHTSSFHPAFTAHQR